MKHSNPSKYKKRLAVRISDSRSDPDSAPDRWVCAEIAAGPDDLHWFQRDLTKQGTFDGAYIEAWQEAEERLAELLKGVRDQIKKLKAKK